MTRSSRATKAWIAAGAALALAAGATLAVVLFHGDSGDTQALLDVDLSQVDPAEINADEGGAAVPALPMSGRVPAPRKGALYWGAFREGAPYDRGRVQDLASASGRWPAIVMWYQEWEGAPSFPAADARWLADRGVVPMVTWEPWAPPEKLHDDVVDQPRYALRRIAEGKFDDYVRRYAREVKVHAGPVMMRPFHEMDGFWYPWGGLVNGNTPADWIAAYRHVVRLFREEGATNATWVWSVNHLSVPDSSANDVTRYWPGPAYVDWVGISGFNWGKSSSFSRWRSFESLYDDRYRDVLRYRKPIVLTEIGAAEVGGDKATWIRDTFATIRDDYPAVRAFVWYDKRDNRLQDWRIESSRPSLAAFRKVLRGSDIRSAPTAMSAAAIEEVP